jgi:hypothetical protein
MLDIRRQKKKEAELNDITRGNDKENGIVSPASTIG